MRKKIIYKGAFGFILLLGVVSCHNGPEQQKKGGNDAMESVGQQTDQKTEATPVVHIEKAHKMDRFKDHEAVKFDLKLKAGDKSRMDATISLMTNSSAVRVNRRDGSVLLFDGKDVCISPDSAKYKGARFDARTWAYFFALPFKINDPGVNWQGEGMKMLHGDTMATAKMTFDSNTGDTPDDWYRVYYSPKDSMVRAAAYIVTFKKSKEEAKKNPHCISYLDYQRVDGVPIAHRWKFNTWSKEGGAGKQIMEATIANVEFFQPSPTHFSPTKNCVPVPM